MEVRIGDIVEISNGERKLVIETREEIVPCRNALCGRTVYRLAGEKYSNNWFNDEEVNLFSKRR